MSLVTFAWVIWLTIIQWTPHGGVLRKANLWCVLGIPGVWWIDLQVDGVRRGYVSYCTALGGARARALTLRSRSLSQTPRGRLPGPGNIIASSCTSPLDVLYLAAIFDPIFTRAHPDLESRLVRAVTIESALAACFDIHPPPPFSPDPSAYVPLSVLLKQHRERVVVVFPENTTSNGRGILKLSQALLSAPPETKVFPVSLRYTPADIVTPLPGWQEATHFVWRLNSEQTHCIRVRIGAPTTMPVAWGEGDSDDEKAAEEKLEQESRVLDAVADALARLGRVKRVGLGAEEKRRFVESWQKGRRR